MAIKITIQELKLTSVEVLFASARACLFEIMLREGGFDEFAKGRLSVINKNSSESEMNEIVACVESLTPEYVLNNGAMIKIELARHDKDKTGEDGCENNDGEED